MSRHHLWIAALLAGTLTTAAPAAAEPSLEATLLPVVTGQMVKMGIPGVIVSVQTPDRGSWQAALGVSDIVTRTPMDVADHVRIGMAPIVALQGWTLVMPGTPEIGAGCGARCTPGKRCAPT